MWWDSGLTLPAYSSPSLGRPDPRTPGICCLSQNSLLTDNSISSHAGGSSTSLFSISLCHQFLWLLPHKPLSKAIHVPFQSLVSPLISCCCCSVIPSCLTLGDPMDCSLPGPSIHGILQARILEWVAMPSSRGSSRDQIQVSCTAGRFFTVWATRERLAFLWLFIHVPSPPSPTSRGHVHPFSVARAGIGFLTDLEPLLFSYWVILSYFFIASSFSLSLVITSDPPW